MTEKENINQQIVDFVTQQKTLILSTTNRDNQALASYTPFIQDTQGNFYIFISDMAEHSTNIQYACQNGGCISILLIADEQDSHNLFARKRLSYVCQVNHIGRETADWLSHMQQFQTRFGKIVELLTQLGDFHLYRLTPGKGNFVQGFGKAYALWDGEQTHLGS